MCLRTPQVRYALSAQYRPVEQCDLIAKYVNYYISSDTKDLDPEAARGQT